MQRAASKLLVSKFSRWAGKSVWAWGRQKCATLCNLYWRNLRPGFLDTIQKRAKNESKDYYLSFMNIVDVDVDVDLRKLTRAIRLLTLTLGTLASLALGGRP